MRPANYSGSGGGGGPVTGGNGIDVTANVVSIEPSDTINWTVDQFFEANVEIDGDMNVGAGAGDQELRVNSVNPITAPGIGIAASNGIYGENGGAFVGTWNRILFWGPAANVAGRVISLGDAMGPVNYLAESTMYHKFHIGSSATAPVFYLSSAYAFLVPPIRNQTIALANNVVVDVLTLEREFGTAGAGAVGTGAAIRLRSPNAAGTVVDAARIGTVATNVGVGTEASDLEFRVMNAGALTGPMLTLSASGNTLGAATTTSQFLGGARVQRTATAASYVCVAGDYLIGVTSTAAVRTITLPAAAVGRVIVVKDESGGAGTNNILVVPPAGTIDGAANVPIGTNYGSRGFYSDGANWYTL